MPKQMATRFVVVLLGTLFFFAIIGVFGLVGALVSLALFVLLSITIFSRAAGEAGSR